MKEYFSSLPSAWDDTVLLGGYPGKYVAMARKKGDTWWISVINGTDEPMADLKIDYSRLGLNSGDVRCTLFEDAAPGKWKISRPAELPEGVSLLPRGGMVAVVDTARK